MQGNHEMATVGDFRLISHRFQMVPGGPLHYSAICNLGVEKGSIVSGGGRRAREARYSEYRILGMSLVMTSVPHPIQGNQELSTFGDFRLISHRFPMVLDGSLHDSAQNAESWAWRWP